MSDDAPIVETHPDRQAVDALSARIYAYNVAQTGDTSGQELAILRRADDGHLTGGLYGWTWGGWLEVRSLWIAEHLRGQGLGSRLLAVAENEARARGCHTAILETHSFQAPAFYQARGYQPYAVLDGYPPGHQKLLLRKDLRARPGTGTGPSAG